MYIKILELNKAISRVVYYIKGWKVNIDMICKVYLMYFESCIAGKAAFSCFYCVFFSKGGGRGSNDMYQKFEGGYF